MYYAPCLHSHLPQCSACIHAFNMQVHVCYTRVVYECMQRCCQHEYAHAPSEHTQNIHTLTPVHTHTHTHPHSLSLSLSLSHTHTHTIHRAPQPVRSVVLTRRGGQSSARFSSPSKYDIVLPPAVQRDKESEHSC
jgi:hypothetical protein